MRAMASTGKCLAQLNKSLDGGKATMKGKSRSYAFLDQMKPRTVYEKAVQDFTETARQLESQKQRFRHTSFSEFERLMALDDGVLKRYGLPKRIIERALREAYETVVIDQQDHS